MWPFDAFKKKQKKVNSRSYAAAAMGRLLTDWVTQGSSADAEIRTSLPKLRARARQLVRDNDYAKSVVRAIRTNVVGQGIGFQAQVKKLRTGNLDSVTNDMIETAWEKWCKKLNCHVAGTLSLTDILGLIVTARQESGEIFIRMVYQPMGNSKVPLALELIEADQLDEMYNTILPGGNTVKMGVELNAWSRPVAYWFYSQHPGDDGFRGYEAIVSKRIRVPAEEIIHLFGPTRPGQTRSVPELTSAILRMHHMGGMEEAEIVGARAAAACMGFIETESGNEPDYDDVQNGQRVTEFEPGIIKTLGPGEKINVPQFNRPGGTFDPFMRLMLRGMAAGTGVSYESISRDYSQSNYSSTRQALLEDRDNYRVIQYWLIENFLKPIYDKWLDLAVLSGEVKIKGYELNPDQFKAARWKPRGWSWIDPMKEVAAYKEAVRCGFTTLSDVINQSGGDLDETFTQRQREIELAEEMDLVFDTDPGQIDDKGQTQPPPPTEPMESTEPNVFTGEDQSVLNN
jgi:lambda family phage portal protein